MAPTASFYGVPVHPRKKICPKISIWEAMSIGSGLAALLALFFVFWLGPAAMHNHDQQKALFQQKSNSLRRKSDALLIGLRSKRERFRREEAREEHERGNEHEQIKESGLPSGFIPFPFRRVRPKVLNAGHIQVEQPTVTHDCQGPPGMPGFDGLDGHEGSPGADGAPGCEAKEEDIEHCHVCPPGPAGSQGPPGSQGPIGYPGERGETGLNGDNGLPGVAGAERGPPGPPGISGERGPRGDAGLDVLTGKGHPGAPGQPGEPGLPGFPGPSGNGGTILGEPGPDGAPGLPGRDGSPGKTGPRGEEGPPGNDNDYCPCPPRSEAEIEVAPSTVLENESEDFSRWLDISVRRTPIDKQKPFI